MTNRPFSIAFPGWIGDGFNQHGQSPDTGRFESDSAAATANVAKNVTAPARWFSSCGPGVSAIKRLGWVVSVCKLSQPCFRAFENNDRITLKSSAPSMESGSARYFAGVLYIDSSIPFRQSSYCW